MSDETSTHQGQGEIIIVKKVQSGGGGHHGGAWKIAYADFVTAMMAFFLVMWLVNAANEDTKASVASYFNPIKLVDNKPSEKGIRQAGDAAKGQKTSIVSETKGEEKTTQDGQVNDPQDKSVAGEKIKNMEADYFENPYAVLAEIAMESGVKANISEKGDGGIENSGSATGASNGIAYRDPFDPDFWNKQVGENQDIARDDQTPQQEGERENLTDTDSEFKLSMGSGDVFDKSASSGDIPTEGAGLNDDEVGEQKPAIVPFDKEQDTSETTPQSKDENELLKNKDALKTKVSEAEQLKQQIISAFDGKLGKLSEGLEVQPAEGGLLLSLTDQLNVGMFNVGSAVPRRDMILMMEKIGNILNERDGAIAIRGHTDARPYSSGGNDNWRLSMARAHSAYFMLVRGGIPEERITQVSGFADRRLKVPEEPYSELNRRIEILIESQDGYDVVRN